MVKTLTDRFIAQTRPVGRLTVFSDTKARGLTLRVGTRTKVWYFMHRNGGPSVSRRLGSYPAMTLAQARQRVHAERAALDQARHPAPPSVLTPDLIEQLTQSVVAAVVRAVRQELGRHD